MLPSLDPTDENIVLERGLTPTGRPIDASTQTTFSMPTTPFVEPSAPPLPSKAELKCVAQKEQEEWMS